MEIEFMVKRLRLGVSRRSRYYHTNKLKHLISWMLMQPPPPPSSLSTLMQQTSAMKKHQHIPAVYHTYVYTTQFIFINTLSILLFKSLDMHFLFPFFHSPPCQYHTVGECECCLLLHFECETFGSTKNIRCAFVCFVTPSTRLLCVRARLEHAKWMVCSCV